MLPQPLLFTLFSSSHCRADGLISHGFAVPASPKGEAFLLRFGQLYRPQPSPLGEGGICGANDG